MQDLQYHKPNTLAEALELMHQYGKKARPYAGGTDLLVQLREGAKRLAGVEHMVDLGGIPELRGIAVSGNTVRVGAMESHTAVSNSDVLAKHAPFLCKAASTVGSPQIRNNGTVGGNICNGSPAADTLSPFVALDAKLIIRSKGGERALLVKDAYVGAGKLTLEPDEIVECIEFESLAGWQFSFQKLGRRKALAISRMNAAVAMRLENGIIAEARIVPGCVFASPDRVEKAEAMLKGQAPSEELFAKCGEAVSEEMIERTGVRWSTEYKKPVVEALVARGVREAAAGEVG